jgi:hypothetical protein
VEKEALPQGVFRLSQPGRDRGISDPDKLVLGGEGARSRRFSDIAGFTTISEPHPVRLVA